MRHAQERITTSVGRTSRLVRQLLELTRQEARETERELRFARLDQVLREIESEYAELSTAGGRPVHSSCLPGSLEIAIDREALLLALGNWSKSRCSTAAKVRSS